MRQALRKSVTNGIRIGDNYDGDGAGGSFSLPCAKSGHGDNHIDFAFGKVMGIQHNEMGEAERVPKKCM